MMPAQSKTLINNACCLDNLTQSGGVIYECAINIVQNNNENSVRKMCAIIGQLAEGEYSKEVVSQAKELKESLVEYYGHLELSKICDSQHLKSGQKEESIEELLEDLNNLIGLDKVKSRVKDLIAYQKIQSLRKGNGLSTPKNTLHLAFMGNPGTGKTHIATGLGIKACMEGFTVYFTSVQRLLTQIREAKAQKMLQSLEYKFKKYDLVICDEMGYVSFDKEGAELLFSHLSLRSGNKATIITTNLPFTRWEEIMKDRVLCSALVDRLCHKAYLVNMTGKSYRIRETQNMFKK